MNSKPEPEPYTECPYCHTPGALQIIVRTTKRYALNIAVALDNARQYRYSDESIKEDLFMQDHIEHRENGKVYE